MLMSLANGCEMKANLEAYQLGSELGYEEGFRNVQKRTLFPFPSNFSTSEQDSFIRGYNDGYELGKKEFEKNSSS